MSQEAAGREGSAAAANTEGAAVAGVEEERRLLRQVQAELAGLEGAGEEIATHTKAAEMELEELLKEKEASSVRINKMAKNIAVMEAANLETAEAEKAKEKSMRREEVEMRGRMADMAARMRQLGEESGQVAAELRQREARVRELQTAAPAEVALLGRRREELACLQVQAARLLEEERVKEEEKAKLLALNKESAEITIELKSCEIKKQETEAVLAELKTVQREKFGAEEEKVRLGGKAHMLRGEVWRQEAEGRGVERELEAATEELARVEAASQGVAGRKGEFQGRIAELEEQLAADKEVLAEVEGKTGRLATSLREGGLELEQLNASIAATERAIGEDMDAMGQVEAEHQAIVEEGDEVGAATEVLEGAREELEGRLGALGKEAAAAQVRVRVMEVELVKMAEGKDEVKTKLKQLEKDEKKAKREMDNVAERKRTVEIEVQSIGSNNAELVAVNEKLKVELKEARQMKDDGEKDKDNKTKLMDKAEEAKKIESELKQVRGEVLTSNKRKEKLVKQLEKNKQLLEKQEESVKKIEVEVKETEEHLKMVMSKIEENKKEASINVDKGKQVEQELIAKDFEKNSLIGEIRKVEEEVAKVEKAFNDESGKVEAEQAMVINGKRRENEEILAKHNKEIGDLKKSLEELNRDLAKANMDKEVATKAGSSTLATMASSTAAARDRTPGSYRRAPTATSGQEWWNTLPRTGNLLL